MGRRLAASTVSSAADQVVLGTAAMHQPALAAIAAMRSAVIPVAGRVRNLNTMLGQGGIAGLKTGSDSAAGGCVLLASWRTCVAAGARSWSSPPCSASPEQTKPSCRTH